MAEMTAPNGVPVHMGSPEKFIEAMSLDSKPTEVTSSKGLSMWLAAVFIVGQMAGSGVLALPKALSDAGWSGLFMLLLCGGNALYCGICLGRCWMILEERWDEYRLKSRYPYASIGSRAIGPKMRYVVSFGLNFTLLGVATVFLLLSSQIIATVFPKSGISFCHWILILAAILCPLMWLGSPEDFWPVAVGAVVTTLSATVLLIGAVILDKGNVKDVVYEKPTFESFSLAFATILFAFGGASAFPTFQNDMRDKSQFPKSASLAFAGLLLLYGPVSISGFCIYGKEVKDNVIDSLTNQTSYLTLSIQGLIAIHLFLAFLLVVNPPAQEIEEYFKIPNEFGWKRCVIRTVTMLAIVFVANTVPKFGKILDLVGGSTTTLMTFVFPPWFYMRLCSQRNPEWQERRIKMPEKIYLIQIMVLGIVGGCTSTIFAVINILSDSVFNPPCYVNLDAAAGIVSTTQPDFTNFTDVSSTSNYVNHTFFSIQ